MSDAKPTNAYELLLRVADHIEEEPKRYFQNQWALLGAAIRRSLNYEPACGTVCCRAGWIVALHDSQGALKPLLEAEDDEDDDWFDDTVPPMMGRALAIIGMEAYEVGGLFDGFVDSEDEAYSDSDEIVAHQPGTPEYAKAGADGLRAFAEQHRERLTARLLADVPPLQVEP